MEKLDRVYVMRAVIGALSGVISAFVISGVIPSPAYNQPQTIAIALGIAIIAYVVTLRIGRKMAPSVPKEFKRKLSTDGIVPFIFVQIVVLVIVYTAIHEPMMSIITNRVYNSGGTEVTSASGVQNHSTLYVRSVVSPQSGGAADAPITGWLEYLRFPTGDCTGTSAAIGNVTVAGGVAPKSVEVVANGTVGFESYYSGDSHYRGSLSSCNPVNILPASSK